MNEDLVMQSVANESQFVSSNYSRLSERFVIRQVTQRLTKAFFKNSTSWLVMWRRRLSCLLGYPYPKVKCLLKSQLLYFRSCFLLVRPGRQQMTAPMQGPQPAMWRPWVFCVSYISWLQCGSLAQIKPLRTSGVCINGQKLFLFPSLFSLCLLSKIK